jgi:uracil phosphoribosyltransferase
MATKIFTEEQSVVNDYLAHLRNIDFQKDRHRMRRYVRMIAISMGYEISKTLKFSWRKVDTPMGTADCQIVEDQIVVASILRAGLPMHEGLLEVFEHADSAFIGAYRKHHKDGTFEVENEYQSSVSLEGKVLILADVMLATGSSMKISLKNLMDEYGVPAELHIAAIIAARDGYEYIQRYFPEAHYWIGGMDEELTAKNYIVPGLGDAGDICYGEKE